MDGIKLEDTWEGLELGIHDGCEIVVKGRVIEDKCLKERVLQDMRNLNMAKSDRIQMVRAMTDKTGFLDSRHLLMKLEDMLVKKRIEEDEKMAFANDPTAVVIEKLKTSGLSIDAQEQLLDEEDSTYLRA